LDIWEISRIFAAVETFKQGKIWQQQF